ncbi:MAG: polysaccharide deacetylase family protein [Candidatus Hodarchaeota archaeon]
MVLYYHAVSLNQRKYFALQMDQLTRFTRPVAADIMEPLEKGIRYACVTFDDGYECLLENALPELTKRNIPTTIFIQTGHFGRCPEWITEESHPLRSKRIMTAGQLKEINNDLISIGSHCVSHAKLSYLDEKTTKRELLESKKQLEAILGKEVKLLSFPHGDYNQKVIELSKMVGYKRVFTIQPTLARLSPEEYVTGRIKVEPSDWRLEFRLKLLGAYRWLPMVFALKRRVSLLISRYLIYKTNPSRNETKPKTRLGEGIL